MIFYASFLIVIANGISMRDLKNLSNQETIDISSKGKGQILESYITSNMTYNMPSLILDEVIVTLNSGSGYLDSTDNRLNRRAWYYYIKEPKVKIIRNVPSTQWNPECLPPKKFASFFNHQPKILNDEAPDATLSTNINRWRMFLDQGQYIWKYVDKSFADCRPQSFLEKYHLSIDPNLDDAHDFENIEKEADGKNLDVGIIRAVELVSLLQCKATGHWCGDYSGPHFLIPCALFTSFYVHVKSSLTYNHDYKKSGLDHYRISTIFDEERWPERTEILRYIKNSSDSCRWGLYDGIVQDNPRPYVLATVLYYVCLRILGLSATDPFIIKIRKNLQSFPHFIGENNDHEENQNISSGNNSKGNQNSYSSIALSIPTWGKFLLTILGLYQYEGINSLFPEIWYILPKFFFCHPSKMWAHLRQLYLPMAYCYGADVRLKEQDLPPVLKEIRMELYGPGYQSIDWPRNRNNLAPCDLYTPHSAILNLAYGVLNLYERFHLGWLRKRTLNYMYQHVCADDRFCNYTSIAPISKSFNMLVRCHVDGWNSDATMKHLDSFKYFWWMGDSGLRLMGTNGSQFWDTCFYVQSLLEIVETSSSLNVGKNESKEENDCVKSAATCIILAVKNYFMTQQSLTNLKDYETFFRHPDKGGFPFSTKVCGWIISDSTAEAIFILSQIYRTLFVEKGETILKTVFNDIAIIDEINHNANGGGDASGINDKYKYNNFSPETLRERIFLAVDCLLTFQNKNGGIASYEKNRGSDFLEILDPAELFSDIMVEHSYVECTSACYKGLAKFSKIFPNYRPQEIRSFLDNALEFVVKSQRDDGSWEGSWGVCFTYAAWFALEVLSEFSPFNDQDPLMYLDDSSNPEKLKRKTAVIKGCVFLVKNQRDDGGWGEDFTSCPLRKYTPSLKYNIVQTAWALLGLMSVNYPDQGVIDRGIHLLKKSQLPNGDWPKEPNTGVFNKTTAIIFTNYKNIFPMWALARYQKLFNKF
ncbi:unnamed protein product [Gordionus sp. m RMFG-2023]